MNEDGIIYYGPERRIRWVHDEDHQTRGSYAYGTEEETKAAEDHEIAMLQSGQWSVLGAIVESKCSACGSWEHRDSIWGIVGFNDDLEALAEQMELVPEGWSQQCTQPET